MNERAGILSNSPLIFALASIRFASWPLMTKKIDEIHDALRDIVPIIQRIQMQQFGPTGQAVDQTATETAWVLLSNDRAFGFQFAPDQILFFSKTYVRYKDFSQQVERGLLELLKHMRFMDVTSSGVRYVDYIRPSKNDQIEKYVQPNMLPPHFPELSRLGGAISWAYKVKDLELRVKGNSQPGGIAFPDELLPLLIMSHDQTKPLEIESIKENEFLMDIDALTSHSIPTRMGIESILTTLSSLHDEANRFFRSDAVCTDYAFNIWKNEIIK